MAECNLIGLTGGIGAGKSVVARVLRTKGYEVYDCDLQAKALMEGSPELREALIGYFGEGCYGVDNSLNRSYLSQKIFSSHSDRTWLNRIVHKAVKEDLNQWCREREGDLKFVESAILHTSGLDSLCSRIWLVTADEEIRFGRAMQRGGIDEENIRARIKAQENEFDSLPQSKVDVIDNSGDASLLQRIDSLLNF
ncbi:MAG: dephospho-CoA kinase [Muribaculaceae bacterium]|nr:dephospho-CoA kinase [Muribaculaceae bacterium]